MEVQLLVHDATCASFFPPVCVLLTLVIRGVDIETSEKFQLTKKQLNETSLSINRSLYEI